MYMALSFVCFDLAIRSRQTQYALCSNTLSEWVRACDILCESDRVRERANVFDAWMMYMGLVCMSKVYMKRDWEWMSERVWRRVSACVCDCMNVSAYVLEWMEAVRKRACVYGIVDRKNVCKRERVDVCAYVWMHVMSVCVYDMWERVCIVFG